MTTSINEKKKVAAMPRQMLDWPDKVRGGQVVKQLSSMNRTVVGPDPAGLAEMIDEAMKPIFFGNAEALDDLLSADQRPLFDNSVGMIKARMSKMMKAVPAEQEDGTSADFNGLDPVFLAARSFRIDEEGAARLADAYRTLAAIKQEPVARRNGMRPVIDPAYLLARIVVVYRHRHGLPIDSDWDLVRGSHRGDRKGRRYSNEECKPKGATAELLCTVVTIWRIEAADHSTLKGALDAYLALLEREGRKPEPDDAVPIFFKDS